MQTPMMPARRWTTLLAALTLTTLAFIASCAADLDEPAGTLTVSAHFSEAAKVGQNTLMITVKDAASAAVSDATVTIDPQMPAHGHGSSETAVVTDNGDGSYTASPVTLQMSGAWTIGVAASKGADIGTTTFDVSL